MKEICPCNICNKRLKNGHKESKWAIWAKQEMSAVVSKSIRFLLDPEKSSYKVQPSRYFRPISSLASGILVIFIFGSVPLNPLTCAYRDIAQQKGLCNRSGHFKIRAARLAPFARPKPFLVMANRPRQRLRRLFIYLHFRVGNDSRITPLEIAQNLSVIAHKQDSTITVAHIFARLKLCGSGWFSPAIVPGKRYRRHIASGGKFVCDYRRAGISFAVDYRLSLP